MNLFSERPELVDRPATAMWTCPITGLQVPKDPTENLIWRAKLLEMAEDDPQLQEDLYTACSQSVLFFINAFVFTLRVFETKEGKMQQAESAEVPFVTWPIQDTHIARIEHAIDDGGSLLTDKSRDMGATWDHLTVLTHRFLFRKSESFLMVSRKEDALDVLDGLPKDYPNGPLSDPGTLFGKIDFIIARLPEWMLPRMSRKKLHLVNGDSAARIDGESSNSTAGSSDRRTAIFLDEFAKVEEAESIKRSTKDVTACRLVCSTPDGPGTCFSKWRLSGGIPVFELPWWEHPEKGFERYAAQDECGRWKIRSPWYDAYCADATPKEVSIELDMDHLGSGDTFFEATIIEQHKRLFARPAQHRLTVNFDKKYSDDEIATAALKRDVDTLLIKPSGTGQLLVWCELIKHRPDQGHTYTVAADISKGQGASNSVASIMCNETREKIAEWADANTPPYEFARIVVALSIWAGGTKRPLVIWENNGDPGFDFGRQLVLTYRYPNIYFDKQAGTVRERVGKRYGWRSSPEKKAAALGLLRRAYAHGRFKNHSELALNECLMYVYYEGGGIGPANLVAESGNARKAHGDRVIADMLLIVADGKPGRHTSIESPKRSFAARLARYKQQKRRQSSRTAPKTFDWTTEE